MIITIFVLSPSTNLFANKHEKTAIRRDIQVLSCLYLLLTPVSWKHVITVPIQPTLPVLNGNNLDLNETCSEKFIRTYNNREKNNISKNELKRLVKQSCVVNRPDKQN